MRITKNDVTVSSYVYTTSIDSEGYELRSYILSDTFDADLQPVGEKFLPAVYGINGTGALAKKMFFDNSITISIGDIIQGPDETYMVKGLSNWYNHNEAVLEPYEVVLP